MRVVVAHGYCVKWEGLKIVYFASATTHAYGAPVLRTSLRKWLRATWFAERLHLDLAHAVFVKTRPKIQVN